MVVAEADWLTAATEAIPVHLRDTPEARNVLALVAVSQTMPIHPRTRDHLRAEWDAFVAANPAPDTATGDDGG